MVTTIWFILRQSQFAGLTFLMVEIQSINLCEPDRAPQEPYSDQSGAKSTFMYTDTVKRDDSVDIYVSSILCFVFVFCYLKDNLTLISLC